MKEKFTIAAVSALACFAGGCVSVDSEVDPAPSRYWKAPQDAVPGRVIQPEDIKTDKIASPEDGDADGSEGQKDAASAGAAQKSKIELSAAEKFQAGRDPVYPFIYSVPAL